MLESNVKGIYEYNNAFGRLSKSLDDLKCFFILSRCALFDHHEGDMPRGDREAKLEDARFQAIPVQWAR